MGSKCLFADEEGGSDIKHREEDWKLHQPKNSGGSTKLWDGDSGLSAVISLVVDMILS